MTFSSLRLPGFTLFGLLLALGAGRAREATAQAEPGRFFLTWNAPYGEPRARDQRTVACGDSARRDTLYVTFDPGRDSTELVAADAEIRVIPAEGDTLDRHWWFESRSNPAHLIADFNLADAPGAERIWENTGAGGVRTVSGPSGAVIRLVWAVRPQDAAVVRSGRNYGFARLIFPRPKNPAVCAKPLCLELSFGRLAVDIHDEHFLREGKRWVSWNPGTRAPCADRVRQGRVTPWRMPGKR